jgi:purine-binding chemotaxis protein CheW
MSTGADRAVVDDYVDALLADVMPVDTSAPVASTPPMPVSTPAPTPTPAPTSAPARPAVVPMPVASAPAIPAARESTTAAVARIATAIADASVPEAPSSAPKPARWLRVSVEGDRYAVELLRVQEVVRMAPIVAMRGAAPAVIGVMNLRGRIVPVYDLGVWLGACEVQPGERARIVVVERDDELLGVLVSSVDDVVTLGDDGIEPPYETPHKRRAADRAIRGVARPGGLPTVLLDANTLFE